MNIPPPSVMDKATFVTAFGGVFEHSAWIAERAFEHGIGSGHDSSAGLHGLLSNIFRSASGTERLDVLHPDHPGKLAAARRLTAESTSEQASAGLDALTDGERARFNELNAAYVAKHGFRFIIAVKGLNKDRILTAFEDRIGHDRATELATAATQVERIARLRLDEMLP